MTDSALRHLPPARIGQIAVPLDDVDRAAAFYALVERGVEFVRAPHLLARLPDHDLWMAFLRDSEGNLLGLMSEMRPDPTPAPAR